MRDFTKNLFSFTWAMSLFGARQLGNLLSPRQTSQGTPDAAKAFDSVTGAMVDQLGRNLRQTFEVGDKLQGEIVDLFFGFLGVRPGGPAGGAAAGAGVWNWAESVAGAATGPAILNARSSAGEEVMITYTRGTGTFSNDKRFIALHNQIYNLDGTENGLHEGVWQALFSSPAELLARPAPPTGTMTEPVGPVPSWPVSANTIAKWTHADGSAISSVGPAASHLIPLSDGSFLFLVITAQIITQGTGRFAGAKGLTQSLGATHVAAGTNLFSPQGPSTFDATTLDTFKFVTGLDGQGRTAGGASGRTYSFNPQAAGQSNTEPAACAVTPNPSESKFVEVRGSRMHYIDTGAGEPILFLHGDPVWSYLWRQVLPHVSPTARCIAPDLIGMGLSDKPPIQYTFFDHVAYVEGFIEALGLERFTMALHDWGCIIGFYIAMRREKSIRGLAFMEAMLKPYASWSDFPAKIRPQFKVFRNPKLGPKLIIDENAFINQVMPASTTVPFTEQEMNCYRMPFLDPPTRQVILQFVNQLPIADEPADVAEATGQYAEWLQRTKLPKLFLWADPGVINSEQDVEWARRHYKNLKTTFLGAGLHFHQQEHPVEVGQEIARWHEGILRASERPAGGRC
ncbi:MAG TPA: haloalkane dehalogenase [Thermoanaerobaculia bacterium]|jgi:haloalkane dehalogenase|nr:haloalkane dehalogenase [Thermoanaerobaculia bacterium]